MTLADYTRHMAEGQRVLSTIDIDQASTQAKLLYAAICFLAALVAVKDPAGGLSGIETRGGAAKPHRGEAH